MSLNFILHGECGVGKTSLRNRWVDGIFTGDVAPTFGVDFNIKTLDLVQEEGEDEGDQTRAEAPAVAGKTLPGGGRGKGESTTKQAPCADLQVKINVYDTSGKPGYREVNSTYLLAFDAVLFVYDISSVSTLNVRVIAGATFKEHEKADVAACLTTCRRDICPIFCVCMRAGGCIRSTQQPTAAYSRRAHVT